MSGAATPVGARSHELLTELPLEIDSHALKPLAQRLTPEYTRRTTVVQLRGAGEVGVGEDVTPPEQEQLALQTGEVVLPALAGQWTLASFSAHLTQHNLYSATAPRGMPRGYRQWAFESAALDLALRQAGRSLAGVLNLTPRPVTFVNSLRLPDPPTIAPIEARLSAMPELRFKLDPTPEWDDRLIAQLAATNRVEILDFKGQYPPQSPLALPADPTLYHRVATAFPDAWLEDPALTPAAITSLSDHQQRITWDAPIRSVADIVAQPIPPSAINIKPARIGTLVELLNIYDFCGRTHVPVYGGGMGELGPGRGQIQYLAALFHPEAPNDIAPSIYNLTDLPPNAPTSPLTPTPTPTGFRWEQT